MSVFQNDATISSEISEDSRYSKLLLNKFGIFENFESEVRVYCRNYPVIFAKAKGSFLYDTAGNPYTDLLCGAGVMNYGHNDGGMLRDVVDYLSDNGIVHSLDLYTAAKQKFIDEFQRVILKPRDMQYKCMFGGPTGTNCVEAALKLARKVTGRTNIVAFTGGFHGMTLGALSATANPSKRAGAGVDLQNVIRMPFDGFLGPDINTMDVIESLLVKPGAGSEKPAAVLLETIQAEGGLNTASHIWLEQLAVFCEEHEILLIVDDIQVGCGRTGSFFSFEGLKFRPDIVCLSKALSGLGLPLSMLLLKPELDVWAPGEHNGTFRGFNLAFISATAAIQFWNSQTFQKDVMEKSAHLERRLTQIARLPGILERRGRGMIQGLVFEEPDKARDAERLAFRRKIIIERCGPCDEVLKFLPALTITEKVLDEALDNIEDIVKLQPAEVG